MHGNPKRQGLGGLVSGVLGGENDHFSIASAFTGDPFGVGSIIGGITGVLPPPQSSKSSQTASSSVSGSSDSTAITSESSSSSVLSTSTPPSATSTPTITSNPIATATQFVSPSPSSSDVNATAPPKSFFQNKPLEGGVFAVVGIVALVLIILAGTVWIRTSSRRRLDREAMDAAAFDPSNVEEHGSMEKLRRLESTSNLGHPNSTEGQTDYSAGYGPPVPNSHASQLAQGYERPSLYNGERGYGHEYPVYVPPRSPNPVYNSTRTTAPSLPRLNVPFATPANGSNLDDTNPFTSPQSLSGSPQRRGFTTLLNSPPASPSAMGGAGIIKQPRYHLNTI